ncbi:3-hydroxyacyl-ACP dehydratase FabZ family protein [Nocardia sp. NPDC127579]|uniref:3-hydroxyacyl-ACP dehydratase FabZ family protein n=1 Tax=Nocardia sp. NPDC127579 TaxID=3345402 RepID=UPI0036296C38
MMPIQIDEIKQRVPHRFPILLVDRVEELVPHRTITATKAITCNEPWYRDVPDDAPLSAYAYPVPLLIEAWCQAAGILSLWSTDDADDLTDKAMLFGSITDIRVLRPVLPGDRLENRVRLVRSTGTTFVFEGTCEVDGQLVLEVASAVVTMRDQDEIRSRPAQLTEHEPMEVVR